MIRVIETGTTNTILRTVSEPISEITSDIRKLARDMKATIGPANGMGLAAPQVGANLRMVLITVPGEHYPDTGCEVAQPDQHLILINPEITEMSMDQCMFEEGCLSLPEFYAEVRRPCWVRFRALNEKGESIEAKAEGIFARILQHEIDHLNGVLFEDYVIERKQKEENKIYI